jgi:methionyl-tRNA formyltransferase
VRLVFFGTPTAAVPALRALVDAGHDVAFVVTQPERRRGRGGALVPSPVHAAARDLDLPVRGPTRAREVTDEVAESGAEVGVVVAFGQLLPAALLDAAPCGFVNLHLSLLPRWRGAAPVERAILAGDTETGVSLMRLDAGLDTGPVYRTVRTPIGDDETAGALTERLVGLGIPALLDVIAGLPTLGPQRQTGDPTYAEKLAVDEFHLDPSRPASELARLVRAGNPRPGAWMLVDQHRVKVLRAHPEPGVVSDPSGPIVVWPGAALLTATGPLVLDEVQVEGRRPMSGDAWLAGYRAKQLRLPVT